MRLIDADALKDAYVKCPDHISFFDFGEIVELFLQAIDKLQTITGQCWHRCEDELPDRYDAYAVGWRYPNGCFYWGKVLFFNDKWQVDEEIPTPDYWMPIEPPKEVQE